MTENPIDNSTDNGALLKEKRENMETDILILVKNISKDAAKLENDDLNIVSNNLITNLEGHIMSIDPFNHLNDIKSDFPTYLEVGHPESFEELEDLLSRIREKLEKSEDGRILDFFSDLKTGINSKFKINNKTALLNEVRTLEQQLSKFDKKDSNASESNIPSGDKIKAMLKEIKDRIEATQDDSELPLNILKVSLVSAEQMFKRGEENTKDLVKDRDLAEIQTRDMRKQYERILVGSPLDDLVGKVEKLKQIYSKVDLHDPQNTRNEYEKSRTEFDDVVNEYRKLKQTFGSDEDKKQLFCDIELVISGYQEFEKLLKFLEENYSGYGVSEIFEYNTEHDKILLTIKNITKNKISVTDDASYKQIADLYTKMRIAMTNRNELNDNKKYSFLGRLENAKMKNRFMNISLHEGEDSLAVKKNNLDSEVRKGLDWNEQANDALKEYEINKYLESINTNTSSKIKEVSLYSIPEIENLDGVIFILTTYKNNLDVQKNTVINEDLLNVSLQKKSELIKRLNDETSKEKERIDKQIDTIVSTKLSEIINRIEITPIPKLLKRAIEMPPLNEKGEAKDLGLVVNTYKTKILNFDAEFKAEKLKYDEIIERLIKPEAKKSFETMWTRLVDKKSKEKNKNETEASQVKTYADTNWETIKKDYPYVNKDVRVNGERMPYEIDLENIQWLMENSSQFPLSKAGEQVVYEMFQPCFSDDGDKIIDRKTGVTLAEVHNSRFKGKEEREYEHFFFDEKGIAKTALANLPNQKFSIYLLPKDFGSIGSKFKFWEKLNNAKQEADKQARLRQNLSFVGKNGSIDDLIQVIVKDMNGHGGPKEIDSGAQNELQNNIVERKEKTTLKTEVFEEDGSRKTKELQLTDDTVLALQLAYMIERKDWGDMKGEIFNILGAALLSKDLGWITDTSGKVTEYEQSGNGKQGDFVTNNLKGLKNLKEDEKSSLERLFFQITMLEPIVQKFILELKKSQGNKDVAYDKISFDDKINMILFDKKVHYFVEQIMQEELKLYAQRFANCDVTQKQILKEGKE